MMIEVWSVTCTDRGQHSPRKLGELLVRAWDDLGNATEVVPVAAQRAENLGGRSRQARLRERVWRYENSPAWALPHMNRLPVARCRTCGRDVRQLAHMAAVKAINVMRAVDPTRRNLDVSYLG